MHTGTISDLDVKRHFGLIDSDDGQIVLFNRDSIEGDLDSVDIGMRVSFAEESTGCGLRALCVWPITRRQCDS